MWVILIIFVGYFYIFNCLKVALFNFIFTVIKFASITYFYKRSGFTKKNKTQGAHYTLINNEKRMIKLNEFSFSRIRKSF